MEYKDFAIEVARGAGRILREGYYRSKSVSSKSGRELLTSVDIASEEYIRKMISDNFPTHTVLAEERGGTESEYTWIVDPLDGTNNFAHSFPFFAVSIALAKNSEVIIGVIYEPLRDELFFADATGAYLNGQKIKVSETGTLKDALLATGFPYDLSPYNENNLDYFQAFSFSALGIRRAGSAALDLAYVACGRFDGFWELKLKVWDMAAGDFIVRMAGGVSSDFDGAPWKLGSDRIVASNPRIHKEMLKIIEAVREGDIKRYIR